MRPAIPALATWTLVALVASLPAQTPSNKPPNLTGAWRIQYTPNLADALGHEPPYTAYGAERWRTVDTAKDPTGICLPLSRH